MRRKSATRRTRALRRVGDPPRRKPSVRAIETTLAELAHEIRTPLTGILALGELLATARARAARTRMGDGDQEHRRASAMLTSLIVDAVRADARGLVLRRDLIRPRGLRNRSAASLDAPAQSKDLNARSRSRRIFRRS